MLVVIGIGHSDLLPEKKVIFICKRSSKRKRQMKRHCDKYHLCFITLDVSPETCMLEAQIDSLLMLWNLANFLSVLRILIMSLLCSLMCSSSDSGWLEDYVLLSGAKVTFIPSAINLLLCSSADSSKTTPFKRGFIVSTKERFTHITLPISQIMSQN